MVELVVEVVEDTVGLEEVLVSEVEETAVVGIGMVEEGESDGIEELISMFVAL